MATVDAQLPDYMRLLPRDTLERIGSLEVLARGMMAGTVTGRHRSPYKGFSVEFAEHRQYTPGDDPRNLDWRIYGKIDRYYVKQYIEETNLRATLLLDASGSMKYAGNAAAPIAGRPASKFVYSQHIAAALTYLLVHQQDAAGLATFDAQLRRFIPARARASQIRVILEELAATEPGAETNLADVFHDIAERIPRRGLVIILSDLFGPPEELLEALHHFRYRKHEVLLLHVMADEELTFPFDRWSDFRDLEHMGVDAQLDPAAIRAEYLHRVQQFLRQVRLGCGRLRIDYVPLNTKLAYVEALSTYLAARRRR